MSADPRLVQSVRQRLTNRARARGEDIQRILQRYAIERLLYRLSLSAHKDRFVLKGATLFSLWANAPYRSTGDLDLLGYGTNAPDAIKAVFAEIAAIEPDPPDALVFETQNITADVMRVETNYSGVTLRFDALLGRARLPIMVDIGYGDIITPSPSDVELPSLLEMPAPRLKAYPPETVIAEKLEAMVALGLGNSRVKDLYDLWAIAQAFDLDGGGVTEAVKNTFARRNTALASARPPMLSPVYVSDSTRQTLWRAFLAGRAEIAGAPTELAEIVEAVAIFVEPVMRASAEGTALGAWDAKSQAWSGAVR